MSLTSIRLHNFRSYTETEFVFDDHLTLITGKNGIGKTNVLEALYVLYSGGSFRVADSELTQYGADWWKVSGVVDDVWREVRYQVHKKPNKQLIVGDGTAKRFMFRDKLPMVLFEPSDVLFVHGSPARRRKYIDTVASNLYANYKPTLARYERALLQRNNLLKKQRHNPQLSELLFVWDVALSNYGTEIVRMRQELVESLNQTLGAFYENISQQTLAVQLQYTPSLTFTDPSSYIAVLQKHSQLDILSGTTTKGPHRDTFSLILEEKDAKQTASRGEVRSLILSMKFAEAALLEKQFTQRPLLLFDDVLSELDDVRKERLLKLCGDSQTIITDTHSTKKSIYTIKLPS